MLAIKRALRALVLLVIAASLLMGCGSPPQLYDTIHQLSARDTSGANSITWSPDSKYIAAGFTNTQVRVWEVTSGREVRSITDFGGGVHSVAWSPHKLELAVVSFQPQDGLRIWNPLTGQALHTLANVSDAGDADWTPDGALLAVPLNRDVKLYDTAQWQVRTTLTSTEGITCVAWSPDSRLLAVGASPAIPDGFVDIWDVSSGAHLQTIPTQALAYEVGWSPDGKFIAVAAADRTVQIWDVKSQQMTGTLRYSYNVHSVDWSPDGTRLAVGSDGEVRIWDPITSLVVKTIPFSNDVRQVRWSPDGAYLGAGDRDGNVTILKAK